MSLSYPVSKDRRYTVGLEWTGHEYQLYVARFDGQWIGASISKLGAEILAIGHDGVRRGAPVIEEVTIMGKLEEIAGPVIQSYHNDLQVHDRAIIERAGPGDRFLWNPREHGTYLVVLERTGYPNASAREHFEACQANSPGEAWYLVAPYAGEVRRLTQDEAAAAVADITERLGYSTKVVHEMHL